jgi:hypothetical protein
MAGCEWRCGCRCRAGMTGGLRVAGSGCGRVMGCLGRGWMLGRFRGRGVWAGWRLAGAGWVIRG